MNKKQLLFENVFIYGLSDVVSKIIPFIFLPIVLNLLNSPTAYGIYTTYITIIGFGTPLVVFGMYDAVFREYFEFNDDKYKTKVLSTSLRFIIFTSIFIIFLFIIGSNLIASLFGITDIKIIFLALISIVVSGFTSIFSMPTRLKNDRKTFVIMSAIIPILLYIISLITLFYGLSFYGLIIASLTSNFFTLSSYFMLNKKYFKIHLFSKKILTKLLQVAIPLVPYFLIYWIYNSMDRIMIVQFLGLAELGIYSVSAKLGSISSILYTAFAGGFAHFAFSTMKDTNQINTSSKLFQYSLALNLFISILFYFFVEVFYNLFIPESYSSGSTSTIYLFLSPLLLVGFQISSVQFSIIRKTYIPLISLLIGLVVNLVLNFFLIPSIGITGASFATFISYYVNIIIIFIITISYKLILFNLNSFFLLFLLLIFSLMILFFYESYILILIFCVFSLLALLFMYSSDINSLKNTALSKLRIYIRKK